MNVSTAIPALLVIAFWGAALSPTPLWATPANKAALAKQYDRFLKQDLNQCTTCHRPAKLEHPPESLDEFPHNPFGERLHRLGQELRAAGQKADLASRLAFVASEDSDEDGTPNELELLLGHGPGDAQDSPKQAELEQAETKLAEFKQFLASYRWKPFDPVQRPPVPAVRNAAWVRNPIDAFIAAEHEARNLQPRPPASKPVWLRRVYLDLIGLSPTPEEQQAFAADDSARAYEKVVDRLLADPRYGERWGRHWMDIWRYSDWAGWSGGNQIRDSKPHIWRWRDWIVESLNQDKGYDRMIAEMLAADEGAPEDPDALRATGYLVRNFKMLSREKWLEDTVKHTSQAFLGLTLGCAKCHDHMYDPVSQKEYYQFRAIFEPHEVRTDRLPGELDTAKLGLVRAFDAKPAAPTYLFHRGDERHAQTNEVLAPAPPEILGGRFEVQPVALPKFAVAPDKREFVIRDLVATAEAKAAQAEDELRKIREELAQLTAGSCDPSHPPDEPQRSDLVPAQEAKLSAAEAKLNLAEAERDSLRATLRAEKLEDTGRKESSEWTDAATAALSAQRRLAKAQADHDLLLAGQGQADAEAKLASAAEAGKKNDEEKASKALEAAKKKVSEAEKKLADADTALQEPLSTKYQPRPMPDYPPQSTGRRSALARWLVDPKNPLTARVAMNHIWLRHFGQAIVPSVADFGYAGIPPTHPALLDWLAAELMARHWSMKEMHRLIMTSSAYRMASTSDEANARLDLDNRFLWRMNSRRAEAEVVRDNALFISGQLDAAMGGPEIDHTQGLVSKRRSLYLRIAAEKEVEFLQIFDGPNVTECYERRESVMPQQALALSNSEFLFRQARSLAREISTRASHDEAFLEAAFRRVLARRPTDEESRLCLEFLRQPPRENQTHLRARENLVLVLFNHNDFVTVR